MMKKTFAIIFLFFFFLSLVPNQALAIFEGALVPCGRIGQPDCQFCHIFVLINTIVMFIITYLAPIIAALIVVIGGLYLMVSYFGGATILPGGAKGGPALFSQAKKIITGAVIGLVIIFAAWVLLNTFLDFIGLADWSGIGINLKEWWNVKCQ